MGTSTMTGRLSCLTLLVVLGSLMTVPARAQSIEELKAMVLKLQARVDQLEAGQKTEPPKAKPAPVVHRQPAPPAPSALQIQAAEQAAAQARQSAELAQQAAIQAQQEAAQAKDTAAAEVKAVLAAPTGKPGGSFRIPGTETVMRIYGFMKLNGSTDLTTFNPNDSLTAQSIPLFGTAAQRQGGATQMSARRSRFDLETWTPVNATFGELHSLMEFDFAARTPA